MKTQPFDGSITVKVYIAGLVTEIVGVFKVPPVDGVQVHPNVANGPDKTTVVTEQVNTPETFTVVVGIVVFVVTTT